MELEVIIGLVTWGPLMEKWEAKLSGMYWAGSHSSSFRHQFLQKEWCSSPLK